MTNDTLPELPEGQYYVPEPRWFELEKRVQRFARRAAKLGQDAITIQAVGEHAQPVLDERRKPTGKVRLYHLVEVRGEAPVVAGYTFVARVEHTEAGNIISRAPGCYEVAVPADIRDGKPTCDHCRTKRLRNDTFVLQSSVGLIRVGRNCLADFLRSSDAAAALRMWDLLQELREASCSSCCDPDECFGSGGYSYESTQHYVACVVKAIALNGWTSRQAAYDSGYRVATSSQASFACGPCPRHGDAVQAWREAQPREEDTAEAAKAIAWARGLESTSDYEHNLQVACSLDYVVPRNLGLVASVVVAYRRATGQGLAKKREEAKQAAESSHFGESGHRYVREVTITHVIRYDYGSIVVLEDVCGNVLKWFTGHACEVGATAHATFTVKGHGKWKGIEETTITRVSFSADRPGHRWVDAEGEVFKSRKAMIAAKAS